MEQSRGRGPTQAKDLNRKLVYQQIKNKRSTTRVEVAKQLGLNKNTVNSIVDEFMVSGFVREYGQLDTNTAGRKPIQIAFDPTVKWAVGAQLTSTHIHWTVTNLYARPIENFSAPLDSPSPERMLDQLDEGIRRFLTAYPLERCLGMSVGVPGLIEAETGIVMHSSHLGWRNVPFLSMLKERLQVPVRVDHSIKLASLGELWHGSGQGVDHFVYCYFGQGIESGSIVNGAILRGIANAAGELGHIVVQPGGAPCGCGNQGCLEALAGVPALLERVSSRMGKSVHDVSLEWILSELLAGNTDVEMELEQAGRYIGQALSYVTNLFNPKLIICDGPLMQASSYLFPVIEGVLHQHCIPATAEPVTLIRSGLYPFASGIGAAASIIQDWENKLSSLDSFA
ncbi:ROK family protein [Paenibacillus sp. strain BS8-2]